MFHSESQVISSGIVSVQKKINYTNSTLLGTVLCFFKRVPGRLKMKPFSFVYGDQTQLGPQRRESQVARRMALETAPESQVSMLTCLVAISFTYRVFLVEDQLFCKYKVLLCY